MSMEARRRSRRLQVAVGRAARQPVIPDAICHVTNYALVLGNSCVLSLQSPRSLGCMSEVERAVLRVVNGAGPSPAKEPRDAHLTIADVARPVVCPSP